MFVDQQTRRGMPRLRDHQAIHQAGLPHRKREEDRHIDELERLAGLERHDGVPYDRPFALSAKREWHGQSPSHHHPERRC